MSQTVTPSGLPPGFVPTGRHAPVAQAPAPRTSQRPRSWAPEGEWRLYRTWGWLPKESGIWRRLAAWLLGNRQQLLYVGVTERTAIARWAEHMKEKWWAPDIACWERDERIYASEADVLAAETAAIWAERPVHNIAKNGNNPGAVHVRRRLERHVLERRLRLAPHAIVWVLLAAGVWWLGREVWAGWDGPRNAASAASIPYAVLLVVRLRQWWKRLGRRSRRRR